MLKETSKKYEQTIIMITHNRSIAQRQTKVLQVSDGTLTDFGRCRMKSYLSLIPISAKVHRRQNRMTLLCIVFAVFMVTAVFSMAEMVFGWNRLDWLVSMEVSLIGDLLGSSMG